MTKPLKILAAIVITLFTAPLYSQVSDTIIKRKVTVSTSLFEYLPTINLNAVNFNIGAELFLNKQRSILGNIGLVKSYGQSDLLSIPALNTKGVKVQLESKYYFKPIQGTTRRIIADYVSVQIIGQVTETKREETIIEYIDNNPFPNTLHYTQNIYTVKRSVCKINFKYGLQFIQTCGLTIDASIGLGGQFISSNTATKSGDLQADIPWNKRFDKGSGVYPNLLCRLKAGWTW